MVFRLNRYMYVYLITNLVNGKNYVGQTVNEPTIRWGQHKSDAIGTSMCSIHMALRKYGINNFQFEVIDESASDLDELNDLEDFYVSFYDTFKGIGYNMTSGGDNALHSKETIEKLRQANLGKIMPEETRKKISQSLTGHSHSEESKKKMSEAGKGRKHSEESKEKMSLFRTGRNGIQSPKSKKVVQLDKITGEEIACWFSMGVVMDVLKISAPMICAVCKGKRKTSGGFKWRYLDVSI